MPLQISLTHQFEQQQSETSAAYFSFDGCRLVSSDGHALYLWRLIKGEDWVYEYSLPFHTSFPRFAPNGTMLAFLGKGGLIHLISVDGKELTTLATGCSYTDWAFSPDGRWLVSSGTQRDILLWDLTTYQNASIAVPFPAFDQYKLGIDLSGELVGRFQFTPDGQRLVFGVSNIEGYTHICHFDPVHKRIIRQKPFPIDGIIANAIAPNGKLLAILDVKRGSSSGTELFIYDLESLQLLEKRSQTIEGRYSLLTFSPDSQWLMCSKSDGIVDIWSMPLFECVTSFAAHPGLSSHASDPIGGLDWSTTGYIVTGGASVFEHDMRKTDYSIKLWKVEEIEDSR